MTTKSTSTPSVDYGLDEVKFLDRNPPMLDLDEVREAARNYYRLDGEFQVLDSERDQNFLIDAKDGARYVLKIANIDETADVVDFQIGALQHIACTAPTLPVPRVIRGQDDLDFRSVRFANGNDHMIFVLTYLKGVPLDDTADCENAATYRNLGALMAQIDIALRGHVHPATNQQHPWNIAACGRLQPLTRHIQNEDHRSEVDAVFEHMASDTVARLKTLRHQVIHQDAHTGNVLVADDGTSKITGIIDFGDMLVGTLPAEIAVACDSIPFGSADIVSPVCEITSGFDSVLALEEDEVDLIFDLISARSALTATVTAARAALTREQPAHIDSPAPYIDRLRQLNKVGRDEFRRRLRSACRFPVYCPSSTGEALSDDDEASLVAARHSLMGRKSTHFYDRPMHFERARGPWLFATDGRRYLDCYNNVPQVGHCHPHVVRAIARQAAALNTNTRYLYSSALEFAERLTSKLAPHLTACVFVNSGSEANDVAWQMAKLVTGNTGAVIMEDAYHGITDVIRHFSPGHPEKILPEFLKGLIVPDPYRGPYREDVPERVQKYAADATRAVAELEASGHGTAAFMVDSAFCSSGVPDVPDGYLRAVEKTIRSAGGLMICDEVQSGFGRMGQWWGHEHHGVQADIVTMGKPVGNGHPLGVVVTTDEILNHFIDKTRLFSTFGGNTVACAAGNAVIDVIDGEDLINRSRAVGDYMREELSGLAATHELIGDVRGHGMVSGLEFVTDRDKRTPATAETERLLELMREHQVLVGSESRDANILKLRPSLVFRKEHVDLFIDALNQSLEYL